MRVQCNKCKSAHNIDDNKIPDKGAKIKCRKCHNIIQVMKPKLETTKVAFKKEVKPDKKKCPYCAEKIEILAIKCRYCKEMLNVPPPLPKTNNIKNKTLETTSNKKDEEGNIWIELLMLFTVFILASIGYKLGGKIAGIISFGVAVNIMLLIKKSFLDFPRSGWIGYLICLFLWLEMPLLGAWLFGDNVGGILFLIGFGLSIILIVVFFFRIQYKVESEKNTT